MATLRLCSVPKCRKPVRCRGVCDNHYRRLRRHGSVTGGGPSRPDHGEALAFLRSHVDLPEGPCTKWPYVTGAHGYGKIWFEGRMQTASRVMCIIKHGQPPTPGHEAAHSCGKGHEGCFHPRHVRWATPLENQADRKLHGTDRNGLTMRGAVLNPEIVRQIRTLSASTSQEKLARLLGISRGAIRGVLEGRTWSWVT